MRWGHIGLAALAFLLCFAVSSLSFLAYASPPDPSWGRGVYDDADFDEVICLIVTNVGLVADDVSVQGHRDFILTGTKVPRDDLYAASFSLSSSQPRPPPTTR